MSDISLKLNHFRHNQHFSDKVEAAIPFWQVEKRMNWYPQMAITFWQTTLGLQAGWAGIAHPKILK